MTITQNDVKKALAALHLDHTDRLESIVIAVRDDQVLVHVGNEDGTTTTTVETIE